MSTEFLTTREAAALLGVGTTSIKRWADTGVLRCVKTAGGHRRFPRVAVEQLLRGQAGDDGAESDRVEDWLELLLRAGPAEVTERLHRERDREGSWWAVAETLGQVLEELGRKWNIGEIDVLQEHLASERLARGVAAVVASLPVAERAPRALLLAAEGEQHTLGLSLVELCLTSAGWRCEWAGRNTPFADVRKLLASREVDLVALSAAASATDQAALAEQAERFGALAREHGVELLVGGRGRWPEQLSYGHRIKALSELRAVLERG